jgi:hypothetical protein
LSSSCKTICRIHVVPNFCLDLTNATKITILALFYHLCYRLTLWLCCELSSHIIKTVWRIQTSTMVSFLHINCFTITLFKAKLKQQNTQIPSNMYRLRLAPNMHALVMKHSLYPSILLMFTK